MGAMRSEQIREHCHESVHDLRRDTEMTTAEIVQWHKLEHTIASIDRDHRHEF